MNSEFKFFRRSNMTANQTATENGSCHQNGMQQRVIPSKFACGWKSKISRISLNNLHFFETDFRSAFRPTGDRDPPSG